MAGIQDFVQMAVQNLGAPEGAVKSATSAVLGTVEKEADAGDFQQLLGAIPGASDLLKGSGGGEAGGGLLGGLMGQAGSALGGNLGGAVGLLGMLQGTGLKSEQFGPFVSMFLKFAKSKAGEDLVGRLLSQAPQLAKLAG
jgi:hypothetical protein